MLPVDNEFIDKVIAKLKLGWTREILNLPTYTMPWEPEAHCWCAMGAMMAVSGASNGPEMDALLSRFKEVHDYNVPRFNDECTDVSQVIEALEKCKCVS
jgi:hypothetical protein